MYWVYILRCVDGSYYTGSTKDLVERMADHNNRVNSDCYTATRLPVTPEWSTEFSDHDPAFRCERQIKGWSRAKKEALIRGGPDAVHALMLAQRLQRCFEQGENQ